MKKFKKRKKTKKKCPRCGTVCVESQAVCDECGLIFSRLEIATNREAKKHILRHDKDFIVYTSDLPKDVKRWKLFLFAVLLGLVGGHYYYVGKYWKGVTMTVMFIVLLLATVFNSAIVNAGAEMYVYFPIGIYGVSWLMSIVFVISNRFKVPVMVEQPKLEDVEKIREDFNKVGDEVRAEIQKNEDKNKEKAEEESAEVVEDVQGSTQNKEDDSQSEDVSASSVRKTGKISRNGTNKKGKKKK